MAHPYCTQNGSDPGDLMPKRMSLDQLQRLTAETDDPDDIDQGTIDQAIEDADNMIDGYCALKFSVPFATVPGRVNTGSAIIARYNLFETRAASVGMPDAVRQAFEDEISFWKDVSTGKASPGVDPPPKSNSLTNAKVTSNPRVFTRDSTRGF
jgi:phage gp36-like protein